MTRVILAPNDVFSMTEIGKNHKKSKIANKRNTARDFNIVTTCDDNLGTSCKIHHKHLSDHGIFVVKFGFVS